jgi:hypothetical protein
MSKVIVYPTSESSFAVIYPILECGIPLNEIARKDVPANKPYLIVDTTMVEQDSVQFDFSNPDGIGIGGFAWFAEQQAENI